MKAIICTKYGPPEVLKIVTLPKPKPNTNEMLIKIVATAVNSGDVRVRGLKVEGFLKLVMRFVLGFTKPKKPILGNVLSGIVEETGDKITQFKPGDEIFAMTGFKFGTYAEYMILTEKDAIALKPEKANFEEAAAIIFGGNTALHFLQKANIANDKMKNVLIYGATGSVGSSAIQIAKSYNAHVTAVCSESGMALAKSLGADEVLDYTKQNFCTSGIEYNIIFDAVGKIKKKDCSACLAKGGRFVTVGGLDVASEKKEQLNTLKTLFDNGLLQAAIDKIYQLDEIVEAHQYVDTNRKKGNVVIKVANIK